MEIETFKAVLVSTLFVTLLLLSLVGIAWSMSKGDELFALSFAGYLLQMLWQLVLKFKQSAEGGQ